MRTLTLTKLFGLIVVISLLLIDLGGCKTATTYPDIRYITGVPAVITYNRPEVNCPECSGIITRFEVTLKSPVKHLEVSPIVQLGEHQYQGILEGEEIAYDLSQNYTIKHEIYICDTKVYDGTEYSSFTGRGINVSIPGFTVMSEIVSHEAGGSATKLLWWVIPQ